MIELRHVDKWYGPSFQALKDCSTSVAKGEVVVVCGPSGSGKSTLIKCVNALEPIQGGEIILDGIKVNDPKTDLPKLRSRVGMVFQHFELFPHLVQNGEEFFFRAALAGRTMVAQDQRHVRPGDEQPGSFESHYAPLFNESGAIIGGMAVVRDITERKRAEADRLNTAIQQWDKVLEIDPDNATAKLERQKAVDLRDKLGRMR